MFFRQCRLRCQQREYCAFCSFSAILYERLEKNMPDAVTQKLINISILNAITSDGLRNECFSWSIDWGCVVGSFDSWLNTLLQFEEIL